MSPNPGNFRWTICALLFFSVALNYIHRLTISNLKGPLSEQLGWSEVHYGYVAGAFSFAYAFGYLLAGRVIDRVGVKRGLTVCTLLWSAAAMAHGLCSLINTQAQFELSYPWFSLAKGGMVMLTLAMPMTAAGFAAARIVLGLAQGGNFPAAIKAVAEWFPVHERALATGIFNAGTNVGSIICPLVVVWMFKHWGWETTFYVTGAIGFAWTAAWLWLYDTPEKHRLLSASELQHIKSGETAPAGQPQRIGWISLLGYRAVWAYIIAGILAAPAWVFYQFFIPDFLTKTFGLSLTATARATSAFYVLAAFGGVIGGWLAGRLLKRGWSLNAARKVSLLACALAVVPVCLAPHAPSAWLAVLIVGIAGSAHQGWSANLFSFVSDTMPRAAISSVVGFGGFVGYFTGGIINTITGYILEKTGSYVGVFVYFSCTYLVSLLALHLLVPKIGQQPVETKNE
ncbi:MAG: MFS transporter [Verrucomicrobiae bacterium]|nr:MFS transporter [Verrucomicrobiae bacterium]